MYLHSLERVQIIKTDIKTAWKFFSDPGNLSIITPEYMNFNIFTENLPDEIYPGLIIEYRISPLWGIKQKWVTEIKHVIPEKLFVDEQIFGPYKFWHHLHYFEIIDKDKIRMIDRVYYKLPFGLAGRLINQILIRNRLNQIFDYRKLKIEEIFK